MPEPVSSGAAPTEAMAQVDRELRNELRSRLPEPGSFAAVLISVGLPLTLLTNPFGSPVLAFFAWCVAPVPICLIATSVAVMLASRPSRSHIHRDATR